MKQSISIITLFTLFTMLLSCSYESDNRSDKLTDCVFEQHDENMDGLIDETERIIMDECMDNRLSSKSSIEFNLIGEWCLIGHGEGWVPSKSQPCAYIEISSEELTLQFQNEFTDTTITTSWEIEEINSDLFNYFKLNIESEFHNGLWITNFCEQFMFGDATPSDGTMYLYEKVQ